MARRTIRSSIDSIPNANSLAESCRVGEIFPETLVQLIYSGEETGESEKMLKQETVFYEQQMEATTNTLTSLLEPILIILVGSMVGIVLICPFLPIFNLGNTTRGGKI